MKVSKNRVLHSITYEWENKWIPVITLEAESFLLGITFSYMHIAFYLGPAVFVWRVYKFKM